MNESDGYVKCEKSKQPKNDQNCGDYPKHVFISLLLSAGTSAISFLQGALVELCCWDWAAAGEHCTGTTLVTQKTDRCPVVYTFAF